MSRCPCCKAIMAQTPSGVEWCPNGCGVSAAPAGESPALKALRDLRIAVGAYAARHKVNVCSCSACEITRAALRQADEVIYRGA